MRTVKEVSKLTGVSVRTLHHYDAIGLLKPTAVTQAGYRLYDDAALGRLQTILLFRELQFPLKEIKAILDSPGFDRSQALEQQIALLELQYQRMGEVLAFAREMQKKGESILDFHAFDNSDIEQYKTEAKERWGHTPEYQESLEREKSGQAQGEAVSQLMGLFAQLGALRHLAPSDPEVQEKTAALREHISRSFYTCSVEVFRALGQMYTSDPRFQQTIDSAGGPGTAAFCQRAIELYCDRA